MYHYKLIPLVGAIAAGNCAVLKPSEYSSHCSALMARLIPKYLDSNFYEVVLGDVPIVTSLLELPWNKIFYTGNGRVAKLILTAAAKHLTPVTLELGGKSPAFIDKDCSNLEVVANRIILSKGLNAGQTCVAVDYVLCHEKVSDQFSRKINYGPYLSPRSRSHPWNTCTLTFRSTTIAY